MDSAQQIELARIIVQLVTALLWPLVSILFLYLFREPLSRFMDRVKKVGGTYFEASMGDQLQQQEEKPSNLAELELVIPKEVVAIQLEETKNVFTPLLGQGKDREEALFKIVASMTVAIKYHRIEAGIFGSQLALLLDLNSKSAGVALNDAKVFYDRAVQQYPATYASYSYDQWLAFLTMHSLVLIQNGAVSLTTLGRGYINFLIKLQLSFNRHN